MPEAFGVHAEDMPEEESVERRSIEPGPDGHYSDENIGYYLDAKLTPASEYDAKKHIESCPVCRSKGEAIQAAMWDDLRREL